MYPQRSSYTVRRGVACFIALETEIVRDKNNTAIESTNSLQTGFGARSAIKIDFSYVSSFFGERRASVYERLKDGKVNVSRETSTAAATAALKEPIDRRAVCTMQHY